MSIKTLSLALAASLSFAAPVLAGSNIMIQDAYARVASKAAKAGAAFLEIHNMGDQDDRLISVSSEVSVRTELHTHQDQGDGVMKMMHVEEGFEIKAGESHVLARGGDHVMFMGLNQSLGHGDLVQVTLTFEKAGDILVQIPVDLERKATHGQMDHGASEEKEDPHAHH